MLFAFLADARDIRLFSRAVPLPESKTKPFGFQHTIIFLEPDDAHPPIQSTAATIGKLLCHRENCMILASNSSEIMLCERRITILGCLQCGAAVLTAPHFSTALITDSLDGLKKDEFFFDWKAHGFNLQGEEAIYHALQFTTFRAVVAWKRKWSVTLNHIRIKVRAKARKISLRTG